MLKGIDELLPISEGDTSVEERHVEVERVAEVSYEEAAHLGVLAEDEDGVVLRDDFVDHLGESVGLAGPLGEGSVFVEVERRVIADLL